MFQNNLRFIGEDEHVLEIAQGDGRDVRPGQVIIDAINIHVVVGQVETDVGLMVFDPCLEFDDIVVERIMIGGQHIEETIQQGHHLRVLLIFQIALRLEIQDEGAWLLQKHIYLLFCTEFQKKNQISADGLFLNQE